MDLKNTIDYNLSSDAKGGFFQRKVAYDNVPDDEMPRVLGAVEKEGKALLEKLDRTIAKSDRDTNPKVDGSGRKRTMVGVYCYAEDYDPDEDPAEDAENDEKDGSGSED